MQTKDTFVLFRTPHSKHFTTLRQKNAPRTFLSLTDIPLTGGYVIAPFTTTDSCPIVFIEPDNIATNELVLPKLNVPHSMVSTLNEETERNDYSRAFNTIKHLLNEASPKVEKVVLSRRLHCTSLNLTQAQELFAKACYYRPSSYVALWYTPQTGYWLVATPEPLLEYAHHQWNTVALAGTLPFVEGVKPQWNEKNCEEQAIVARFIEKQMQGVATNVQKSKTFTLQTGNLQHLCTHFCFNLAATNDVRTLLTKLHPTPAVCGLPREAALQTIMQTEASERQYYAGFSGPLFLEGHTNLYVSLRCMSFNKQSATLYAGGGIMPQSTEQEEWDETQRKLITMKQLL
uniref:isochorismate synthase n=1 Tax=Alloprevotella sp. TaxID=1872471 RepID=UPI003FF0998F